MRDPREIDRAVPYNTWIGRCSLTHGPPLMEHSREEVKWGKVTEGLAPEPIHVSILGQYQQDKPNKRAQPQRGRKIDRAPTTRNPPLAHLHPLNRW